LQYPHADYHIIIKRRDKDKGLQEM
jgi:hypothetical protein